MKEEANEPNRNENHIYHRILSWCGEHKMKLLAIVIILGVILGGHSYLYQDECDELILKVEWAPIEGFKIDEGAEPIFHCYENQELELIIKVTTSKAGHLKITAEKESGKPVDITTQKGDWGFYSDKKTIIDAYMGHPLIEYPIHIWAKSDEEPEGYLCGITIKGSLNGCQDMVKAFIDVSEQKPTPTPEPTDPGEDNDDTGEGGAGGGNGGDCLGTSLISILTLIGYINSRNK